MCGFAGFKYLSGKMGENLPKIASNMGNLVHHRGPDDKGIWYDTESQVAFSHQRLAIQDLSSAGHQPMTSKSGRYVIVFNGEIYNHLDLRSRLLVTASEKNECWKGKSDTETLIEAIDQWGIEETLKNLLGMFSFAVWDKKHHLLTIARDRLGEKPILWLAK